MPPHDILFGGSFDPIHRAHIAIATKARSQLGADRFFFLPTKENPLKPPLIASPKDRLIMLHLATRHLPWATVLPDEIERTDQKPSYTIDTLEELLQKEIIRPKPYLLIGSDILPQLPHWHRIDDLLSQVTLAVITRQEVSPSSPYPYQLISIPHIDISSTSIRETLSKEDLHPDVWEYINYAKLYQ
ncbi:nicotinate (nicotinamide) nucleotide adenylyltransferase [Entomospira culicis]|uniref:Probable nicotinate-nucleotide adenylyltransferase n=1 Tax=Entomospira culicis TaxID=2719989 RepID=A0A968GIU4_9SPIO|nr:nicotinate (nicotinamide) nucleotide adenylyltransferase [Entomospira culicis]NIZ19630.1 nicotinate (nicotinamide) nucleotide adenylyltransferase [Entomospira culicis]NIZ69465.1 nicotinate (nicotinamide) nucleotide adenylyltransferase [Entomospira culicis]WDI36580.1 nicotinate (nicotinamide) nucleotide adenylyltransferase [Entomospira culicis]WDI38208.1 nicotinate (nicotinamide) nucleotide adenylyltransferase [Entomospira culicis]